MKLTTLLLGLLLSSACYSQNTAKSTPNTPSETPSKEELNTIPTASITRTIAGSNYTYQFVSNRLMSPERATRWEDRFVTVYPELVSISIDSNTQEIELVLPDTHSTAELEEMVVRFGYSGYQLTN